MESVVLTEVDTFSYPTFFTATFDYFATGEGHTVGVVMAYARSAAELRAIVNRHFETYYAKGATIWPRLIAPPEARIFLPEAVIALADEPSQAIGDFFYASTYRRNLS